MAKKDKFDDIKINNDKTPTDKGYFRTASQLVKKDDKARQIERLEERISQLENQLSEVERMDGVKGGNLLSVINVGGKLLRIDGKRKQIVINDGQTDRILIGFDQAGF